MRTTLNIDDALLVQAQCISGLTEKTALVREGLVALIGAVAGAVGRHGAKIDGRCPLHGGVPITLLS